MNKSQFYRHFHLFSLASTQTNVDAAHSRPERERKAAVLIAIFEDNKQLQVLFTLRASHLKHHAGQVCFPGGKVEPSDQDIVATALREADEEIGLKPENINVLGKLHKYQTLTGFAVTPIVGFIKNDFQYQIDQQEVAEVFSVPLNHFLNHHNHLTITSQFNGKQRPVTFMPYQHYNIWGATAAMLKDLAIHLRY
ncbi:MAG: CoA pyrophosphatase [Thalassotalea sp.]